MKKILLCTLVLLFCFLAACGGTTEPSAPSSVEPSPSMNPSTAPTSSPTPNQEYSPIPEPRVELLSYEEYFSEEREIEVPFASDDDDPFDTADGDWYSVVRKQDGFVVAEGTTGGYATVVDKDGYYREVAFAKDKLYITEDKGETPIVVYEATGRLRPIFFSDGPISGVVLGFVDGTRRYRLYVPTRTIDFMFDLPDVPWCSEWDADTASDESVFVDMEGLSTNQTWVCAIGGGEKWGRAYANAMGWDYERVEFSGGVPFWYDSTTGKWSTWGNSFDWAMDMAGIPEELRVYDTEKMSYEEYFSEIRNLECNSTYYTTLPNDHDGEDLCRQSDGGIVVQDIYFSGSQPPLFWEFVPEGNVAYSTDAHTIYRYDDNSSETTLLYDAGEEEISHFVCDQHVLFVLVDTEIRRVYLPTGQEDHIIDKAYSATDGIHFGQVDDSGAFEAKTNCQVIFGVTDYNWYAEPAKEAGVTLDEYINGWYQDIGGIVYYNALYDVFASNEPLAMELLGVPTDKQMSILEYIELVGDNY